MRRKDREETREFAIGVVDKCKYAIMSTINTDGSTPYGVVLSIARIDNYIYFHCAKEGHKIDNLKNNNSVCITCVGDTSIPENKFTVNFESAIVFGKASEVTDDNEKIEALRAICIRYTPDHMGNFDSTIQKSLNITWVWKVSIDNITGKCNKK